MADHFTHGFELFLFCFVFRLFKAMKKNIRKVDFFMSNIFMQLVLIFIFQWPNSVS
jgi:hypothetical protein